MIRIFLLMLLVASIGLFASAADNPLGVPSKTSPFVGTHSDGKLTIQLVEDNGAFTGTIALNGTTYQAKAQPKGEGLEGTFVVDKNQYPFSASVNSDIVTLESGGVTYTLKSAGAETPSTPRNSLAVTGGATPGAPSDQTPTGEFSVLGSTQAGRTLFLELPDARDAESVITRTADALVKIFDAKPSLSGAFADSKTKRRGGALFTAKLKGHDLRGWIFFSLGDKASSASVVYSSADASQADISTLFAALPAQVKMKEHPFPDGSGSIDLPPGWTTPTQTLATPLIVKGPAGQTVAQGIFINVNTPDCRLTQLAKQTYQMKVDNYNRMLAMSRNLHTNPPPPPGPPPDPDRDFPQLIFCRYCPTPDEAVKELLPILFARQQKAGGPAEKLERVIESTPTDPTPLINGSQAAKYYVVFSKVEGGVESHQRAIVRIECCPVLTGKDSWTMFLNQFVAPDATFDRDLPVMTDIVHSLKVDQAWFTEKLKKDGEALRQRGEAFSKQMFEQSQQFQAQQKENFNRFQTQMQAQYKARHDANSDFIEMIGGVRTVCDTKTGERTTVDLNHVGKVVEGMNTAVNSPNQFVEIPLRNER
jgi:hypothetical protein